MTSEIRVMTPGDIPAGMRLKEIAGWNQTVGDWRRFLRASPAGCFVAEWGGQIAGTVTTIIYQDRFAWIGMVLVDPEFRGRGIGTALLVKAIDYLDNRAIPCLKLDATPQGRRIYERLGFRSEYGIERQSLKRDIFADIRGCREEKNLEFHSVLDMDREVFGADRSLLLKSLANGCPELVVTAHSGASLGGYALGRKGSQADHLGPWVASDAEAARETLENFLRRSQRETVFVDVPKGSRWASALLAGKGFQFSRTLTRMYRGENSHPGRLDRLCAILGPEFG